jgi:hypothetical protein
MPVGRFRGGRPQGWQPACIRPTAPLDVPCHTGLILTYPGPLPAEAAKAPEIGNDVDVLKIPLPSPTAAPTRTETGNLDSLGVFDAGTLLYIQGKGTEKGKENPVAPEKTLEQLVRSRIGELRDQSDEECIVIWVMTRPFFYTL